MNNMKKPCCGNYLQRPSVLRNALSHSQRNYHIQLGEDRRYYSVPYAFAGKKVKVLYDNKTIEILL